MEAKLYSLPKKKRRKLPELQALLEYQNPLVLKRFKRNMPKLAHKAEALFQDVMNYLWLCRKHERDLHERSDGPALQFRCVMHKEMRDIDEMWHTFILITIDYHKFCDEYFDGYMHHVPEAGDETDSAEPVDLEKFRKELTLFLRYAYDNLGEETVKRWFSEYL